MHRINPSVPIERKTLTPAPIMMEAMLLKMLVFIVFPKGPLLKAGTDPSAPDK